MGELLWLVFLGLICYWVSHKNNQKKSKGVQPNQPENYYEAAVRKATEYTAKAMQTNQPGNYYTASTTTMAAGTGSRMRTDLPVNGRTALATGKEIRPTAEMTGNKIFPSRILTEGKEKKQKTGSNKMQAPQTDIVARAKANAGRLKEDVTMKEIEQEHGHSEKEAAISMEHSRNCQALKKAEEMEAAVENQLGSTEDLIVKGYSGNLSFDRDFLGEAMDMLSAISTIPGQ